MSADRLLAECPERDRFSSEEFARAMADGAPMTVDQLLEELAELAE